MAAREDPDTPMPLNLTTLLFVPASRPDRFAKAAASGADAVVLDLEDAVSADDKVAARGHLQVAFTDIPVVFRVNALGTPWHAEDIEAAMRLRPAAVMLPKAEGGADFARLVDRLSASAPVIALLESARGLADARTIAAVPGVAALAFGSWDFCADLGCEHTEPALLAARSEIVLASRLAGREAPMDGVTTVIDDPARIEADARYARSLGFGGKLVIHPKQVAPAAAGFRPNASEIEWAEKILASGDAAAAVDGAMVDEPVRVRARSILARARRAG